ncbi:MAG: UDP-N-acetylglucosamine 2-epimerase [Thaumarchaeota archaeon 13_1_40CM_4_38_7]|nr:MAG: UDP-N-acetylglucosamine 2-epimerase [Thaumarchaeota archaeon 13_1_40CM_4_38_7]OLC92728.1 MAG: UDP-N-acetylglucosamine 2-epimerase [Thaumarchaeota archaeon 13_1_40CM_3_38_6]
MTKIGIVMGTRPEIIKLSPIIKKLPSSKCSVIFTGQHYDYDLGLKFVEELGLRTPDVTMKLKKSGNSPKDKATQIGEIVINLAKSLSKEKPDATLVLGDTNTILAAGMASLKNSIPLFHVEAGLRSFDWRMPEEHNRIVVDHISELLFAPTSNAKKNLESESVHGSIFVTGNTVIDAVEDNIDLAEKKSSITIRYDDFILVTFHRSENVDDPQTLGGMIKALLESDTKFLFPIHPHTLKNLHLFGLYDKVANSKNIILLEAIGYFDMLLLMKKCRFIVTDSGGLQEEATSPKIRKKVLVIRKTTDRPESIRLGFSELVGTTRQNIVRAIERTLNNPNIHSRASPYGNGRSSEQIVNIISKYLRSS